MTISTGIGPDIYSYGRLLRGASGNARDIGHMVVDPSFGKCVVGSRRASNLLDQAQELLVTARVSLVKSCQRLRSSPV